MSLTQRAVRHTQDGMASKAKQHQASADTDSTVTRICSINPTGLVFIASRRFDISAEISLGLQTSVQGTEREWDLCGWVVDCRTVRGAEGLSYQVTMLFSDVPEGLQGILTMESLVSGAGSHPRMRNAPIFGVN